MAQELECRATIFLFPRRDISSKIWDLCLISWGNRLRGPIATRRQSRPRWRSPAQSCWPGALDRESSNRWWEKKKTKNLSIDYLWKMFYELHFVNKEILFRKGSTLFCSKYMFTSLDQVTSKKLRGKPFLGMNSSRDKCKPCTQVGDEKVVCWGPGEEGALRM